jgi:ATP-binding protein involved in chromosome partitioning
MTIQEIKTAIETLVDPSRGQDLAQLNAIKHIGIDEEKNTVVLIIEVGKKNTEITSQLSRQLAKVIKLDLGFKGVLVEYEQVRPSALSKTVRIIGIISGKGGVGKSSVTANLAYAMTSLGKKVGVIDADIYGANLPKIFDLKEQELIGTPDEKIYPAIKDGIEMVSTEFFVEKDRALMWRGPLLGKVLKIFFEDTIWSQNLDYLLIDFPPGTGDVMMDVSRFVPDIKVLLVTTPHPGAAHIAIKAGFAAVNLKQDLLGVIENMSYYEVDDTKHYIFGTGGGEMVADKLLIPLIHQIPIGLPDDAHNSIFPPESTIGIHYLTLARKIMTAYDPR